VPVKPNKVIIIVGIMGSGKSSVGRRLAKHYNLPFVDSDLEVEKAADCTVKDFFEMYGEEEFRACENRVIKRILSGDVCVLSSGGGAFLYPKTRELAEQNAVTVWLRADEKILFSRLKGRKRRPKVPSDFEELKAAVHNWVVEGEPVYGTADIVVSTKDENASFTTGRVIAEIDKYFAS